MNETVRNLFDPRFGKRPSRFVGRDDVLRDLRAALTAPEESDRATLLTGIKGVGKSSILAEMRREAGIRCAAFATLAPDGGLLSMQMPAADAGAPQERMTVYLLDDANPALPGLRSFLEDYGQRIRAGENILLLLTALPNVADELLKAEALVFLRHTRRITLGNVQANEVLAFFEEAFSEEGAGQRNALLRAAEATAGYPYLIQLIGYYLSKEYPGIDDGAVDKAIFRAKIELYKNIHEPLFWSLSSKDRVFLWAMAQDDGASEFGEIARRMGVSTGYASKYRERLISAGAIYSSAYGELSFTLPFMKIYIEKEYVERLGGEGGKRRL